MSNPLLSLFLDFAVLMALVGTIYFALRLSKSLNNFRAHRNEMKSLIAELTKNINDAQGAIEGLKATSNIAANNLDDVLHDSRRMAEELKMINENSNNIANRLEKAALQGRQTAQDIGVSADFDDFSEEEEYFDEPEPANSDENLDAPSFFIQDREFEEDEGGAEFTSEAERDLYEALKNKKKSGKKRA